MIEPPPVPVPPHPPPFVDQNSLPTLTTQVNEVANDIDTSAMTPQAEILRCHYQLAHRSFKILHLFDTL